MTAPTIPRYDCEGGCPADYDSSGCGIVPNSTGDWVRWEDYERLLRELEALRANESA